MHLATNHAPLAPKWLHIRCLFETRSHYVALAGLKLREIYLPMSPKSWN